jgi:hypothetical protein
MDAGEQSIVFLIALVFFVHQIKRKIFLSFIEQTQLISLGLRDDSQYSGNDYGLHYSDMFFGISN